MIQQSDIETGQRVWEGTWEAISAHASELSGHRVRVVVLDVDMERSPAPYGGHASARGKYAGLLSSDDIMRSKLEDIAIEDRRR